MRKIAYQVMIYSGALLLTAYCVVPLVWMLLTSLKPPPEVITYPPAILPKEPTLRNFRLLFEESLILTLPAEQPGGGVRVDGAEHPARARWRRTA